VPRISAPTLAEHRARQREALLTAATELLVSQGPAAVTPAAVGAAAGLARSSVYQYFSSSGAILAAIIEESFPRSSAGLRAATEGLSDPLEIMEAFIRELLHQAAQGAHRPATALRGAELPPECFDRLDELHEEQIAPFRAALMQLDLPAPRVTGLLVGGMLQAAVAAVDGGADAEAVTEETLRLVRAAVGAPA